MRCLWLISGKKRCRVRRNKSLLGLIVFLSIVTGADAQVKQVWQEGTVEVRCETGRVIEVVVPAGVASLVRSGDPSSLKVEHVSGRLFITPVSRNAAEIVVIDTTGRSYRLRFVFDQGVDEKVVIASRRNEEEAAQHAFSSIDLIRELAAGRAPAGAVEQLREDIVFEDELVRIKTVLIYEMPDVIGYVLTAENLLPQSLVVPVERFNFPGLLAVTSQKDILSPAGTAGAKGILYMVASR